MSIPSSGNMGCALEVVLADMGAKVTLISGPTSLTLADRSIEFVKVVNAQEMFQAGAVHYPDSKIAVFAAAVADFTPQEKSAIKIKKEGNNTHLALTSTKDIALEMGRIKQQHQINVGFALETNDEETNAREKLKKKNFDFIVLNSLNDRGAGFAHDTNRITIIDQDNNPTKFELKPKKDVAHDIVSHILKNSQL